MKYEKPDLEELDLILEGSFLEGNSTSSDKSTVEAGGNNEGDSETPDSDWL